ncbi:MAG TPA: hypothetical protein VGK21_11180 [Candidatus Angelobacter sp.]
MTEAEWLEELIQIEVEITHVVDIFHILEEINRLPIAHSNVYHAFNKEPLFWNIQRDCLQESLFIGLGRLCDSSPDAIDINRVLNTAMVHPEFFSEEALIRRWEANNVAQEHIDNLLVGTWKPKDRLEFRYLKKAIAPHIKRIEDIYRPIRNAHYGHRLTNAAIHQMFALTNRGELSATLDALHELVSGLIGLYRNGKKPEIGVRSFKSYNNKIKEYARNVIEKVVGGDLAAEVDETHDHVQ